MMLLYVAVAATNIAIGMMLYVAVAANKVAIVAIAAPARQVCFRESFQFQPVWVWVLVGIVIAIPVAEIAVVFHFQSSYYQEVDGGRFVGKDERDTAGRSSAYARKQQWDAG
ncbi:hypothetical protein ACHAWC_011211, partial [Mediolabrus comicus]